MIKWPPWMVVALAEEVLNVREIAGPEHNQRILMYHDETSLDAEADEVPWCSSFVNYCIRQCGLGLKGTHSARARSWLRCGTPLSIPAYGCITILSRGSPNEPGPDVVDAKGHVGFFIGKPSGFDIKLLGGNQSDSVCRSNYDATRILGYRWPVAPTRGDLR